MYIYKIYKVRDYNYSVTQFYESWTEVGFAHTLEEAMEIASRLAFEDDEPGDRLVYTEKRTPGGYFNIETLGGVIIDVPPLPHSELEYVVTGEYHGNVVKKYYTAEDLED